VWILQSFEPAADSFSFQVPPHGSRTVGRAHEADVVLDAPLVSRLHCRLQSGTENGGQAGPLQVIDLGSTNGTYVNGQRVDRSELKDGDRLRIGRMEFTVSRQPDGM
jgi:pSer/pThr/pTyr-binding forkhead associated (FHA) protein